MLNHITNGQMRTHLLDDTQIHDASSVIVMTNASAAGGSYVYV